MSIPLVDIETISNVRLAIIGGSGLYNLSCLEPIAEVYPDTPWGKPSDHILVARLHGTEEKIAFLSRHGEFVF
jgi:5'-methylthioadenosine phosphorylase